MMLFSSSSRNISAISTRLTRSALVAPTRSNTTSLPSLRSMASASSSAAGGRRRLPLTVSPRDLAALPASTTKILDVSWHMPNLSPPRNPTAEYLSGPRLPRAIRWDLDEVATLKGEDGNELGLGHMMPSEEKFREACAARGIQPTDSIILYDTLGTFSSPRGAYTFAAFNHPGSVAVLDGGLPRWKKEMGENELEMGEVKEERKVDGSKYENARGFAGGRVVSYSELLARFPSDDLVFDARSRERFLGTAPEPRPGLSSGHMPRSISLPFNALLVPAAPAEQRPYTSYRPMEELKEIFVRALSSPTAAELDPARSSGLSATEREQGERRWAELMAGKKRVISSCGSGMTACVVLWAMRMVAESEDVEWDKVKAALYDESWTGYALRKDSEIIKGNQDA